MLLSSKSKNPDKLVKSTVRIVNEDLNGSFFVGTGFFFSYNPDPSWNSRIEAIVTNRHVVKSSKTLKFSFRTETSNENIAPPENVFNYDLVNPSNWIFFHPDPTIDLCIIFLKPITDYFLSKHQRKLDIAYFNKELVPNSKIINMLTSIEDVIMIGYPEGIIEPKKLYPVVRRGITATPFFLDFNDRKEFLTDIFAIGGSSGSPVILYSDNGEHPYLLGIHYAGLNNNKLNLGVNIKSTLIIETFEAFIHLKLQDPEQQEFLDKMKRGLI